MKKILFFLILLIISTIRINVKADTLAENAKSAILIEASTGEIIFKKNETEKSEVLAGADDLLLQRLAVLRDLRLCRPSGGILVELHAVQGGGMVDADGRAAAALAAAGDVVDRDVRSVLLHGVVLPQADAEVVDVQHELSIADGTALAGDTVDGVLMLRHLPEAEAQDQQQDAQVAHPCPPEADAVLRGE